MNKNSFKAALAEAGLTQEEFAKRTGICVSSIINKIRKDSFKTNEVRKIVDVLGLTPEQAMHIFFPEW